MTYLNPFHKEATERKIRKIDESSRLPMNSEDAANYMKQNYETAKAMEVVARQNNSDSGLSKMLVLPRR